MAGGDGTGRHHPGLVDLGDPLGREVGVDGALVELVEPGQGLGLVEGGQVGQLLVGVGVAGPDALQVEHGQASELTEGGGHGRAGHRIHGRGQHRELEPVGVDLAREVDQVVIPGATTRQQ